jgi:transcription elongation factor Elf1
MFGPTPLRKCVQSVNMESDHPSDFTCPRCQARYKTVRMQSEPGIAHGMLQCVVCGQSLAPTESDAILKYFLLGRPRRNNASRKQGESDDNEA